MKVITALLATTLLASAPAIAAEDGGFYVGAGAGSFGVDVSDVEEGIAFNDDDTSFKLFGGYNFNKYFGVELEYLDGGTASESYDLGEGATLDIDIDTSGFNASIVGMIPIGERFNLFAKLGMIFWDVDYSADFDGVIFDESDSGEDLSWGLGAGFDFTERFGARIEYQEFDVHDADSVDLISASVTWSF